MKKQILKSILIGMLFLCMGWGNVSYSQWVAANSGLTINEVNSFTTIGSTLFASTGNISGNGHGVFKSTDSGGSWTAVNNGLLSLDTRQIISVGDTLYVAIAGTNLTDGGIYKSTDQGGTWVAANNGLPRLIAYTIVHLDGILYISINAPASVRAVYLSSDYGNNWTITSDPVLNDNTHKSIVGIGGNIIVGSDGGTEGTFLSTDNGATWNTTSITNGTDALAIVGTTVFAATGIGVKKSTDNGLTWTNTTNASGVIDNATALEVVGNCLMVATPGGRVFSSDDSGVTWNDVSTGASGSLGAEALWTDATYMYAGVCFTSTGVWRRPLSEFSCGPVGIESSEPEIYTSVFPNPASDILSIELGDQTSGTIELINMNGSVISTQQFTQQKMSIYIGNLTPGIYMVRVTTIEGTSLKKLIKN